MVMKPDVATKLFISPQCTLAPADTDWIGVDLFIIPPPVNGVLFCSPQTINSVLLPNFLLPLIIRSQDTCIYDLEGEQQGVGGGKRPPASPTTRVCRHLIKD